MKAFAPNPPKTVIKTVRLTPEQAQILRQVTSVLNTDDSSALRQGLGLLAERVLPTTNS